MRHRKRQTEWQTDSERVKEDSGWEENEDDKGGEREGNRETVTEEERSTGARQLLFKTTEYKKKGGTHWKTGRQLQQNLCLYK